MVHGDDVGHDRRFDVVVVIRRDPHQPRTFDQERGVADEGDANLIGRQPASRDATGMARGISPATMPGQLSRISGLLPGPPGACANAPDVIEATARHVNSHTRTSMDEVHKICRPCHDKAWHAEKTPAYAGVSQISARSAPHY